MCSLNIYLEEKENTSFLKCYHQAEKEKSLQRWSSFPSASSGPGAGVEDHYAHFRVCQVVPKCHLSSEPKPLCLISASGQMQQAFV